MPSHIAAIGEAMVEFAPVGDELYRRAFAGDTFNALWHMAQLLGGEAAYRYMTCVGDDSLSDSFRKTLQADGIDPSFITCDPERTMGLYLIELDGAERSFQYWRGQSAARGLADDPEALWAAVAGCGLVYLSGITLAILPPQGRATLFDVLDRAREDGARIAFDPNYRPRLWSSPGTARAVIAEMKRRTDIALPSFDDEQALWGDRSPEETLARFGCAGVPEIMVKNGGNGVSGLSDGFSFRIETPSPETIRDTSGAGDAFNAGYLSGRLLGRAADIAASVGYRTACEVLGHPGARAPQAEIARLARTLMTPG